MSHPDILYCIEHVARELDIACAIRSILRTQYQLDVHIHVFANDLDCDLSTIKPRVIAVPYCRSRRDFGLDRVVRACPGVPIVNLAFEQLLSRANQKHRAPSDDLAQKQVVHVAAGEFVREWLTASGVPAAHVALLGSMTCQLYQAPYRHLYLGRRADMASRFGLSLDRPWIFLPENFVAAFFSRAQLRYRRRRGYDAAELLKYVEFARESFRQVVNWCVEAAEMHNIELIVRPRPAIAKDAFQRKFLAAADSTQPSNLHFIKEGDVREWIFASQLVASSYSSTLVEAAVAGKPVFQLLPCPLPHSASSAWTGVAPAITTREEFLATARSPAEAPAADALRDWAEANLLSQGDAIGNAARLLASACQDQQALPRPAGPNWKQKRVDQVRGLLKSSERAIRRRLRGGRRPLIGHECDSTTADEINARTDDWQRVLAANDAAHAA